VILTKGSTASALFALDFVMTNVPAGTVVVGDAGFSYAQANETRLGVLAIATTAEAQAGTIDTKIVTPLKLAQVTATETRKGVIALASSTEAQALVPDATKALTVARLVDRTATTGRAGVVILASNTEAQAGTDATKAVTPSGLASLTATDARSGLVELATNAETQAGTDTTRAVTPASLASRTATDARAGIVELATNAETQTGTDTARAVTPASLASAAALFVPPGVVVPFAMNVVPSGWLAANGAAVSRTTYAALFAAIGTLYGVGDGSTTFNLPDLRGYFVRGSGTNTDGTASGAFGTKQADAFKTHNHGGTASGTASVSWPAAPDDGKFGGDSIGNDRTFAINRSFSGTASVTITAEGDLIETRPKNMALLYCIKF
jgi:hypothetical protein